MIELSPFTRNWSSVWTEAEYTEFFEWISANPKSRNLERNIGGELTQAAKEIKAHKEGKLHPKVVSNDIILAGNNLKLSQSQFAAFLGVSKRTLEQWEQERRDPVSLLNVYNGSNTAVIGPSNAILFSHGQQQLWAPGLNRYAVVARPPSYLSGSLL